MVIKASAEKQTQALVADLSSNESATREAAVARLTVIGARAITRLIAAVQSDAPPAARTAALRILEAIADPRALEAALDALDDRDAGVAAAAAAATRPFLRGRLGAVAVDRLTAVAIDATRHVRVRAAAIHTLGTLEPSTIAPLWNALGQDPSPEVRALVDPRAATRQASSDPAAELTQAAEHNLPNDPAALRQVLSHAGDTIPLLHLHRIVERVRDREAAEPSTARRDEWRRVRAAAHVALANRGSRLGVYDLRESLEALGTGALPVEFLSALSRVGDASCLEAIATAFERSRKTGRGRDWWRDHLADAFRTIVQRERITRRHAVMKKLAKRLPQALDELWPGRSG